MEIHVSNLFHFFLFVYIVLPKRSLRCLSLPCLQQVSAFHTGFDKT